MRRPPRPTLCPYTTLFRSNALGETLVHLQRRIRDDLQAAQSDGVLERPVLGLLVCLRALLEAEHGDRKSTRLNSSHLVISYAVFCLKKKKKNDYSATRPTG